MFHCHLQIIHIKRAHELRLLGGTAVRLLIFIAKSVTASILPSGTLFLCMIGCAFILPTSTLYDAELFVPLEVV